MMVTAQGVSADVTTIKVDPTRAGWRGDEAGLAPPITQRFDTPVSGQVYAQPLVFGNTVIVATENDMVYGIDRSTGAVRWQRSAGTPEPASIVNCVGINIDPFGVTATPVIDPATGIVYVTARTWDGTNASSAQWLIHAFNATTGAPQPGWPAQFGGTATNDPTRSFDPVVHNQRPGLLLMGGRVHAAFGSFCDHGDYRGWVGSVSTSSRAVTMWVDEANPSGGENNIQGAIWQSGGGLASDGPGRIFLATGNGTPPPPGPASLPSDALGMSEVRLQANADGSLAAADRFSPYNASSLSNQDLDFGSSGPTVLPDGFGKLADHPHLLVQPTKTTTYLLDRDNLGGEAQGPNGSDAAVAEMSGQGTWSHAATWPGDGGFFYTTPAGGPLTAFRVGANSSGQPVMSIAGTSAGRLGYGSGAPVITSNGTVAGSAILWVIDITGYLRVYKTVPSNGQLQLLWTAPISTPNKFSVPATDGSNIFVATSGHLLAFASTTQTCTTYSSPATGSHQVCGAIRAKYEALGGPFGFLGYPLTDQTGTPDGIGRFNHFANNGSIYWTPSTGAWSIHGAIRAKWASLGWERSVLGYPVTDESGTPDGIGRFNHFANNGSIYWTPSTGAWSIHGDIRANWATMGWERSCLGYPVSDEFAISGGRQSNLQRGFITWNASTRVTRSSC
jgi:LGFP repeat/PQQ-like domain